MAAEGEFDERFPDIIYEEAILFPESTGGASVQLNGNTLDGKRVWIWIHGLPVQIFTGPKESTE